MNKVLGFGQQVFGSNYDNTTINRQGTVYDQGIFIMFNRAVTRLLNLLCHQEHNLEHYDKMERLLDTVEVEVEPEKFEGEMRQVSMEFKLNSFEQSMKKAKNVFPTTAEVREHEEHEENEEFASELDLQN
jgi:hypothetical protein